jgi:hypothetical protein
MLGLIIVAGMVPGLLIGLRRTTAIDYDAVAYRTAAILAEDPGWPVFPPWENSNNADGVDRIGLAVAKESPNILSMAKIEKFNDSSLFSYPDDYRKRIIFGDYPYRFNINISLKDATGALISLTAIGDPIPTIGDYGYIKRVVKIKGESYDILDLNSTNSCDNGYCTKLLNEISTTSQTINITLNMSTLIDKSINPVYQYDPRVEPINITMYNFNTTLNCNETFRDGTYDFPDVDNLTTWNDTYNIATCPVSANLSTVRFYKNENPSALPFDYDIPGPDIYSLRIDGILADNLSPHSEVKDNISLIVYPGYLPLDEGTKLDIRFTFQDTYNVTPIAIARTLIGGSHEIEYNTHTFVQQNLSNAWLEVAVW